MAFVPIANVVGPAFAIAAPCAGPDGTDRDVFAQVPAATDSASAEAVIKPEA